VTSGHATLDLVVLGVLLLFALAGAFSGALHQLVQLAAVVAGWLSARHLPPRLAATLLGPRPPAWERGALAAGCFLGAVVVVSLVGRAVARGLQGPEGTPGPVDRALGALLGGLKAALGCWVLLSALALAHGPVTVGGWRVDVRASDFGSLAARHNLLEATAPHQARLLSRLFEAVREPAVQERLRRGDAGLKKSLEDPRVKALLERAAREGETLDAGGLSDAELEALVERLEPEARPER
jgi:membrane protein required for colicin V production